LKDEKLQQVAKQSVIIQEYEIENFKFRYFDESSKIKMVIDSLNHKGTGVLQRKIRI
jgi:hypothetical protein